MKQEGVQETPSQAKTVTESTSHSQRQLASLKKDWSKGTGQSLDEGHQKGSSANFEEVRTHLVLTEAEYMEPKTGDQAKKVGDWDQRN